ncbi:hypothetical protein [Undibacterium sp. Xuan67W]|uniref:hypothetical protein n=1 Tax=Undibacterium sp. Xuan67W TaxID=3413057 RepID=UPI003BF041D7
MLSKSPSPAKTTATLGPSQATFDRAVSMAQGLQKMVSMSPIASNMSGAAKNKQQSPSLFQAIKLGSALSKQLNPALPHTAASEKSGTGGSCKPEAAIHQPGKEQLMHFAEQLKELPGPDQGDGNILKETVQYGQKVQALSQSLMTPPATKGRPEGAEKNHPATASKAAASEAHSFKTMGKEAAVQRMQTIMQTMHGPAHPVHKVMDVLSDFSKGKIDKDGLRNGFSGIGAQLSRKGSGHGHGTLPGSDTKTLQKQAHGFAQIGGDNNASLIIVVNQAMSEKIAAKLKESQMPATKPAPKQPRK